MGQTTSQVNQKDKEAPNEQLIYQTKESDEISEEPTGSTSCDCSDCGIFCLSLSLCLRTLK